MKINYLYFSKFRFLALFALLDISAIAIAGCKTQGQPERGEVKALANGMPGDETQKRKWQFDPVPPSDLTNLVGVHFYIDTDNLNWWSAFCGTNYSHDEDPIYCPDYSLLFGLQLQIIGDKKVGETSVTKHGVIDTGEDWHFTKESPQWSTVTNTLANGVLDYAIRTNNRETYTVSCRKLLEFATQTK